MAGSSAVVAVESDIGTSALDQSLAAASAQAISKALLYPLDTWKARRQASRLGTLARDSFDGLWTMRGMYRGLLPKLALYSPYQAIYMAAYVQVRDGLTVLPAPFAGGPLTYVCAGVVAEVSGSLVRLPMEVSKLRLQLGVYRSTWHACQELFRHPRSYYNNFVPQTLLHDCSYSAIGWVLFEMSRQQLFAWRGTASLPAYENLALGTSVGAVSAWITTPLDVLKTRIVGLQAHVGVAQAARAILREEGPRAFWRGASLRVLHSAPAHGLYMALYEAIKIQIVRSRSTAM